MAAIAGRGRRHERGGQPRRMDSPESSGSAEADYSERSAIAGMMRVARRAGK
jgi:hypothetical protein